MSLRKMFSVLSQSEAPDPYWGDVELLWRADDSDIDEKRLTSWTTDSGKSFPTYTTGQWGSAAQFGTTSLAKNPSTVWNPGEDFTIEFWYKRIGSVTNGNIFTLTCPSSETGLFSLHLYRLNKTWAIDLYDSSNNYVAGRSVEVVTIPTNYWYYLKLKFKYQGVGTSFYSYYGAPGYKLDFYVNNTFSLFSDVDLMMDPPDGIGYITRSDLKCYLGDAPNNPLGSGNGDQMVIDDFRFTQGVLREDIVPTKRFPNF